MSLRERFANWARFQTIITVFAKHGFSSVLSELGLSPSGRSNLEESAIPSQLRMAFEELGPTFVKLGQLLSTRPDLLPEDYIREFSKLTDSVPAFAYSEVERIVATELAEPLSVLFSEFDQMPLAAASIAQVHRATIRETGEKIVLKIQRPGINRTVQTDIQILYRLAGALEKLRDDIRLLNPSGLVKEFQRSINEELDFTLEARYLDLCAKNMSLQDGVVIPQPIWAFTTKKVLAMTRMEGISLSQIKEIPPNVDRVFLAESIVTFFLESIFFHGIFHADAHAGNILLQTEGRGRLVVLDFGMVGTLGANLKNQLSKIFMALVSQDYESLASTYMEIGEFGRRFSTKDFRDDIRDFLRPQLGKPLKDIDLGQLMLDSTKIARRYQVRVPRDLILFYRSIITLEHVGRKLDPNFDFLAYGKIFAKNLVRRRFSSDELMKDLLKTFEGLRTLGTELPSQVRTLVQRLEDGDLGSGRSAFDTAQFKQILQTTCAGLIFLGSLLGAILLTSMRPDHMAIIPLWFVAIGSGIVLILNFFRPFFGRRL